MTISNGQESKLRVSLIDYTGAGTEDPADYAAALLIFTKNTRLKMHPGLLDDIKEWPRDRKLAELEYMANTIPSSWEFCDYTFLIEGVTRAFTHQLVRTRTASFAQQTMRVLEMDGWDYETGPSIENNSRRVMIYEEGMRHIDDAYKWLIDDGAAIEDARGILPTNILTNIVMKLNLRNLADMLRKRTSSRTQDEYRRVIEEIRHNTTKVHPWATMFLSRSLDKAAQELESALLDLPLDKAEKTRLVKLVDQMRYL